MIGFFNIRFNIHFINIIIRYPIDQNTQTRGVTEVLRSGVIFLKVAYPGVESLFYIFTITQLKGFLTPLPPKKGFKTSYILVISKM